MGAKLQYDDICKIHLCIKELEVAHKVCSKTMYEMMMVYENHLP